MLYKCEVMNIGEVEGEKDTGEPVLVLGLEIKLANGGEEHTQMFLFDVKSNEGRDQLAALARVCGVTKPAFTPKELMGVTFKAKLRKGKLVPLGR